MKNTNKELWIDMELLTAALLQAHVYVVETSPYDPDEPIESGGLIKAYSPLYVRIENGWYLRKHHSFRVDV